MFKTKCDYCEMDTPVTGRKICGECSLKLEMSKPTPTTERDWVKRFDRLTSELFSLNSPQLGWKYKEDKLKSFIQQELDRAIKAKVEAIEKLNKKPSKSLTMSAYNKRLGYNQALKDIIKLLQDNIEED